MGNIVSARNTEFGIWDFALASGYKGEIWDLQAKLGPFQDFDRKFDTSLRALHSIFIW